LKLLKGLLKRGFLLALIFALAFLVIPGQGPASAQAPPPYQPYAPGELLIKYVPGTSFSDQNKTQSEHGLEVIEAIPQLGILRVKVKGEMDKTRTDLEASPAVQGVQPNYLEKLALEPNDPYYKNGQSLFPNTAADANDFQRWYLGPGLLNAEAVWDITTGRTDVVIAIIDSGVALTHPDLAANIWVNPGEVAGNGLDDDNNGLIDDVNGWDFKNNDNNPNPDLGDGIDNDGDGAADDATSHGTMVAGVAGAIGNNGAGVAGVAWKARIMPLKVFADDGAASSADVIKAVVYAADKGAHVINLSLGSDVTEPCPISRPLNEAAVSYAFNKGSLVVVSAGNSNNALPQSWASCTKALSVGASGHNSTFFAASPAKNPLGRASFTNFGSFVDVVAPGTRLTSEYVFSVADQNALGIAAGTPGIIRGIDGTSFSAPLVSGLAALMISRAKDLGIAITPATIMSLIESTALNLPDDPLDSPDGGAGWDGKGRVQFLAALQAVNALAPAFSDALSISDSIALQRGFVVNLNETLSFTDSVALKQSLTLNLGETLGLTDSSKTEHRLPTPVPGVTEWGLLVLALLLAAGSAWRLRASGKAQR